MIFSRAKSLNTLFSETKVNIYLICLSVLFVSNKRQTDWTDLCDYMHEYREGWHVCSKLQVFEYKSFQINPQIICLFLFYIAHREDAHLIFSYDQGQCLPLDPWRGAYPPFKTQSYHTFNNNKPANRYSLGEF